SRSLRIAVVATGTLHGSGFASRICSMIEASTDGGHQVDLFHARFPGEESPPDRVLRRLRAYRLRDVPPPGRTGHLHTKPPLMWACERTAATWGILRQAGPYDVVQCEAPNAWGLARRIDATARVVVYHDDDFERCRRLA